MGVEDEDGASETERAQMDEREFEHGGGSAEDPNADGELMEGKTINFEDGEAMKEDGKESMKKMLKINVPRQFNTKDEDYQEFGYTKGCAECKALLGRTSRQKHSEECRKRMSEALVGYKRVQDAKERKRKFIEEIWKANEYSGEKATEVDESVETEVKKNEHSEKATEVDETVEMEAKKEEKRKREEDNEKGEEVAAKRNRNSDGDDEYGSVDMGELTIN